MVQQHCLVLNSKLRALLPKSISRDKVNPSLQNKCDAVSDALDTCSSSMFCWNTACVQQMVKNKVSRSCTQCVHV